MNNWLIVHWASLKSLKIIHRRQKLQVTHSSVIPLLSLTCFGKWTLNFLQFTMFVSCWRNCTAQGLQSGRICNSTWHSQRDLLYNFRSMYLQRKPWSPISSTLVWKFDVLRSIGQNSQQNDHKRKTKMICDGSYSQPCVLISVPDSSM